MNLQQIIAMTTKKHEEEEVYQKIYFLKNQRDEEIMNITGQIYRKYREKIKEEENKLTLRKSCNHELLLRYDVSPKSYDAENFYCLCCGKYFNVYNCDEKGAREAIKLSSYYHDYDERLEEVIKSIEEYMDSLYMQDPNMDIQELRRHIKEFVANESREKRKS